MDVEMEAQSELPEELVSKILARLPLRSLVRSRAVCKAWNEEVSSRAFFEERLEAQGGARECMLLAETGFGIGQGGDSWAYDAASDLWHKLDNPSLWWREQANMLNIGGKPWRMVSASGSILLSTVGRRLPGEVVWEPVMVHLGNPVVNSWASLPALPGEFDMVGMLVDATARRFQLVAVKGKVWSSEHVTRWPIQTFIFDSALWRWIVTSCILQTPKHYFFDFPRGQNRVGVFLGTVLYCLTLTFNLVAYDMDRGVWSCLDVARPPDIALYRANLVKVRERLLCVVVWEARRIEGVSVKGFVLEVWELDFTRMTWTVLLTIPDHLFPPAFLMRFYNNILKRRIILPNLIEVVAGQDHVYLVWTLVGYMLAVDLRQTPATSRWLPSVPLREEGLNMRLHSLDPWLDLGSWKP